MKLAKIRFTYSVLKSNIEGTDSCARATPNTVRKQFYYYLLSNGCIERLSRGVYKITEKGEKLSEILT